MHLPAAAPTSNVTNPIPARSGAGASPWMLGVSSTPSLPVAPMPPAAAAAHAAVQAPVATTALTPAAAPAQRHIDHWNEQVRRGANGIAESERVSVGTSTFQPLMFGIPGYHFSGGVATMHAGVELLVEQGGSDAEGVITELSGLIDVAPVLAVNRLAQVKVEARQDDGFDRYFEKAYRIPGFKAVAASGPGQSVYFGGRIYSEGAFFHELGHVAGDLIGSHDWMGALKSDDAVLRGLLATGTLTPRQLGPVEPDPARRARWTPRLAPGGVTPYGDQALKAGGTAVEDICESLKLRTVERYFHDSMATYRNNATGAERAIGFSELYPNRAALLAALGPSVAEQKAADDSARNAVHVPG